jgi:hypothetical protein
MQLLLPQKVFFSNKALSQVNDFDLPLSFERLNDLSYAITRDSSSQASYCLQLLFNCQLIFTARFLPVLKRSIKE